VWESGPLSCGMRIAVLIPGGGASGRYFQHGGVRSKLDEDMGGKPVLQRTVEVFTKFDEDDCVLSPVIVAGPHADVAYAEFFERHGDRLGLLGAQVCKGGVTHRWETVAAALAKVPAECTHIAVHDAARPCVSPELLSRVFRAARVHDAVIPAVRASDTVKRVEETAEAMGGSDPLAAILGENASAGEKKRVVRETLDRSGLVLVQTPQVFRASLLREAYARVRGMSEAQAARVTDDASLVEGLGQEVVVVEGDARNIKITVPADAGLARAIMGYKEDAGRPVHKKF
jgi:2-C-methyl-D-erythritol 4-phosphate cytidylyltransferase